jgi:hypothetical protein
MSIYLIREIRDILKICAESERIFESSPIQVSLNILLDYKYIISAWENRACLANHLIQYFKVAL